MNNLAYKPGYANEMKKLKEQLIGWQHATSDPWICAPGGVYEAAGAYKGNPQCLPMYNGVGWIYNVKSVEIYIYIFFCFFKSFCI